MPDDKHRAEPAPVGPPRHRMSRTERARAARLRRKHLRRRRTAAGLSVLLVAMIAIAVVFLGSRLWRDRTPVTDYTGDGGPDVLIEVHDGDWTTAIAQTLYSAGVIANVDKFLEVVKGNSAIAAIQPGFYVIHERLPAQVAAHQLVDPENRVGKLVIPEGRQLDDVTDMKTDKVTPGVFSLIAKASCLDLNDDHHCVGTADLRKAAETMTTQELGVPAWAAERVTRMGHDHRRIEGLITAGTWNVDPNASPQTIVASLIADGASALAKSGLPDIAEPLGMTPYDLLVVASLVQREALPQDFAKVARVIYNRLNAPQRLEFDSTVNYPLDRQEVATTDADRAKRTPWNTYATDGLPATPICSPGTEALQAAEHPAPGDWLYFVTVDKDGTTLFTHNYQQHLNNIEQALDNGVLDSSR